MFEKVNSQIFLPILWNNISLVIRPNAFPWQQHFCLDILLFLDKLFFYKSFFVSLISFVFLRCLKNREWKDGGAKLADVENHFPRHIKS